MKNEKVEISELKIKLGEIDVILKPKQAKQLYEVLKDLFEEKTVVERIDHHYFQYPYIWYYTNSESEYKWDDRTTVWCNSDNQTLSISDSGSNILSSHEINTTNNSTG